MLISIFSSFDIIFEYIMLLYLFIKHFIKFIVFYLHLNILFLFLFDLFSHRVVSAEALNKKSMDTIQSAVNSMVYICIINNQIK